MILSIHIIVNCMFYFCFYPLILFSSLNLTLSVFPSCLSNSTFLSFARAINFTISVVANYPLSVPFHVTCKPFIFSMTFLKRPFFKLDRVDLSECERPPIDVLKTNPRKRRGFACSRYFRFCFTLSLFYCSGAKRHLQWWSLSP